jgi:limonene 1,2-monooxygenase
VIGTPDDLIARIHEMWEVTGGFGVVMGFVNDWATPEAVRHSWTLVARHVMPEIQGHLAPMRASNRFVQENRGVFDRAGAAILSKIQGNERAAQAFETSGLGGPAPIAPHHAPGGPAAPAATEVTAGD